MDHPHVIPYDLTNRPTDDSVARSRVDRQQAPVGTAVQYLRGSYPRVRELPLSTVRKT
ncbi:hypothetical protein OH799_29865 [Nocardia sp. NBC_00881]|uniref:hypothetical protein n=1 Tax=Nocardia sp. NBC_00881 TaxID=2975995 RepID=UPI003869B3D2|nr:hypothetical protein OH799_29865 [Nocardia sp. NBC_00881]